MEITNRQKDILKFLVEKYVSTGEPVGSKEIVSSYLKDISSATVRNDLNSLEELGYLSKTHTSSGRIPTTQGYSFYNKNLLMPVVEDSIKVKLEALFNSRLTSIENIISDAVSIINDSLKLPSVTTTINEETLLKRIDIVPIGNNVAIVLLVTSSGEVLRSTINYESKWDVQDVVTCIRILNDRLIDTPLADVNSKLHVLKDVLKDQVTKYELLMQDLIKKIFDVNSLDRTRIEVKGSSLIAKYKEFNDTEKLSEFLSLIENTNIWKQIAFSNFQTGKTTIIPGNELGYDGLSVVSTIINSPASKHQIAVVGPDRMNYQQVKGFLDFIKKEVERIYESKKRDFEKN